MGRQQEDHFVESYVAAMDSKDEARAALIKQRLHALHMSSKQRALGEEAERTIKNAASKIYYTGTDIRDATKATARTLSTEIVMVDLAVGLGGALISMDASVKRMNASGTPTTLRVAHASDWEKEKTSLYSASAAALGVPVNVCVADVRDEKYFTTKLIKSWGGARGIVDTACACIPCETVSSCGDGDGLAAVEDYIVGLFRIIAICRPLQFFLECVERIESDVDFKRLIIDPLEKLGYFLIHGKRDGHNYGSVRRSRWYLMATLNIDEFNLINTLPPPPDRRDTELAFAKILLAPAPPRRTSIIAVVPNELKVLRGRALVSRETAPLWAYLPTQRLLTKAERAIKERFSAPADGTKSGIVNFQFKRVNEVKGYLAPTITATESSDWYYHDAYGIRLVTALEVGLSHGYPISVIQALLAAARFIVISKQVRNKRILKGCVDSQADNIVRRAIGDGFVLAVVTDILFRMIRARTYSRARDVVLRNTTATRPTKRARLE